MNKKHLLLVLLAMLPGAALADCYCACMNGRNQAICENSLDIKPICGPAICPIQQPSIPPIMRPQIPPVGTRSCRNEQVWDHNYRRYVWKSICR